MRAANRGRAHRRCITAKRGGSGSGSTPSDYRADTCPQLAKVGVEPNFPKKSLRDIVWVPLGGLNGHPGALDKPISGEPRLRVPLPRGTPLLFPFSKTLQIGESRPPASFCGASGNAAPTPRECVIDAVNRNMRPRRRHLALQSYPHDFPKRRKWKVAAELLVHPK